MFASLICVASPVFRSALSSSPQPYFNLTAGQGPVGELKLGCRLPIPPQTRAWRGSAAWTVIVAWRKMPSQSRQHGVLGIAYTEPEVQLEQKRDWAALLWGTFVLCLNAQIVIKCGCLSGRLTLMISCASKVDYRSCWCGAVKIRSAVKMMSFSLYKVGPVLC